MQLGGAQRLGGGSGTDAGGTTRYVPYGNVWCPVCKEPWVLMEGAIKNTEMIINNTLQRQVKI